jgi:neutral ceramidase
MLWALTKEDAMVIRCGCLAVTVVLAGALSPLHAQGQFRAGAARVDITPAKDAALPLAGYAGRTDGFKDIHDRLYARAIVVGDGSATAAIVTCDLIGLNEALWQRIQARVSAEIGILPDHLLLAGTHTHGAPNITALANDPDPKRASYVKVVEDGIMAALQQARANLKPARVGAGAGKADVSINRRALMADGTWWLGRNPEGPSDKTVGVVKFESTSGEPIALLINYGVHGTAMSQENYQLTADVPGTTSRYVEQHFAEKVVAVWTSGAAGDQNPIYGPDGKDFRGLASMGRILGEEALRVAAGVHMLPSARIRAAQTVVSCPGQRLPEGYKRQTVTRASFLDAPPVDIRLSLLMVDKIALAGVSGEVLTMIGQRLKRESPFTNTIMITHANGSSGYLPDDAAYERISYEIVTARVKPGCAESAITDGFLRMMDKF